jgi:hypothetical protein
MLVAREIAIPLVARELSHCQRQSLSGTGTGRLRLRPPLLVLLVVARRGSAVAGGPPGAARRPGGQDGPGLSGSPQPKAHAGQTGKPDG